MAEHSYPQLRVNWTWFILAILILWTLALGYFPSMNQDLSASAYWMMALVALAGIFLSIVLHELSHSLMARRFGLQGKSITLFIFGGVADLQKEPTRPGAEFWIAVVGPAFSIVFATLFAVIEYWGTRLAWSQAVLDVTHYLALFNFIIAYFNLIPAFPLDGGRIFRSIVWAWTGDVRKATRIASGLSTFFGWFLIFLGVMQILALGPFNFINGIWLIFLGAFLITLAKANYLHVLMSSVLAREPIERAMKHENFSVHLDTPLSELVDDVYKYHTKIFPVTEGEKLVGCVEYKGVKNVPEREWNRHQVREIVEPQTAEKVVSPREEIMRVFDKLKSGRNDELIVADQGRVVGRVSLRDILDFFTLKMELGG